jgi:S-adenosylmethionine decarboxylase proenzyme
MIRNFFKIWSLYALFCFISLHGEEAIYEFTGHHLLASYLDCDREALINIKNLEKAMNEGAQASGATILSSVKHVFPPDGFTMVILLSESHASIHTYPEHGACFVDFFTCGHSCDASKFDQVLIDYLKPQKMSRQLFQRDHEIKMESE